MVVQRREVDEERSWLNLADSEPEQRQAAMVRRFNDIAGWSEPDRYEKLRELVKAEASLTDEKLMTMTDGRLRAWLALEPAKARLVAGSHYALMHQIPTSVVQRRVGLAEKATSQFSEDEKRRLRELRSGDFAGEVVS